MDVTQPGGPLRNEKAEALFLGCMLLKPELVPEYAQAVEKSWFYVESHRVVWGAIEYGIRHGRPTDLSHVLDYLNARRDGTGQTYLETAGGMSAVARLQMAAVSPDSEARVSYQQLREYTQRRQLQRIALDMRGLVEEGQPAERVASKVAGELAALTHGKSDEDETASAATIAAEVVAQMHRRLTGEAPLALDTGIHPVNVLLDGGLAQGVNTVLGALSGHGKTTLASAMVAGLLNHNPDLVVDWYSCEVPEAWQGQRIMSSAYDIPERYWRTPGESGWGEKYASRAGEAVKWLTGLEDRLRIYRMGEVDVRKVSLKASARRVQHSGPYVIVVDYIQRATYGRSDNPIERVAAASQALAGVALDANAAVIGLSQFTTQSSGEPIPLPNPMNARWSKEVLNDAADFLVYHRPYHSTPDLERRCILQLAKSRYGRLGHVEMLGTPSNRFRWWEDAKSMVPGLHTKELIA